LIWAVNTYPPHWDNLMELRMYFTSPNQTPYTSPYPAAVIRITGNTWSLVSGGGTSCTAGTATAVESLDLPKSEVATPQSLVVGPAPSKSNASTTKSGTQKGGKSSSTSGSKPAAASQSGATTSTSSTTTPAPSGSQAKAKQSAVAAPGRSSNGGSGGTIALIVAAVVVLAAAAGGLLLRRRRLSRATTV
jgi:hypothetical protein